MSEIRKTTTIDNIDVPQREPLISLADVITAAGWIAYQGTRLAVKGTVLAYKGGKAMAEAVQETRRRNTSISGVGRIVASSSSAKDALTSLAGSPGLEMPIKQAEAIRVRLESLVASNDKAGVVAVAQELVIGSQNRLHAQLIPLVAESCQAIGFVPQTLNGESGLIEARKGGTRQSLSIDVAKAKDGGVQIHFDAKGFTGGVCVQTLDALQRELRARGVQCNLREQRRKQDRPVIDRAKIARRLNNHCE